MKVFATCSMRMRALCMMLFSKLRSTSPDCGYQAGKVMHACCHCTTLQVLHGDTQGWALLGSAFPSMSSLSIVPYQCAEQRPIRLDPGFMHGLSACTRLTTLKLNPTAVPTSALAACVHLLPKWLPHVRTLECGAACTPVIHGLAMQLQHLKVVELQHRACRCRLRCSSRCSREQQAPVRHRHCSDLHI